MTTSCIYALHVQSRLMKSKKKLKYEIMDKKQRKVLEIKKIFIGIFLALTISSVSFAQENSVTNITVQKYVVAGSLLVRFTSDQEIGVDHYNIQASVDNVNFKTVATSNPVATNYSIVVNNIAGASIGLFALLLTFTKKIKYLIMLISICLIGFACKKDFEVRSQDYRYVRIQTVLKDGSSRISGVVKI